MAEHKHKHKHKPGAQQISSGIDELVERLKSDGIQAGQQQALDIIAAAEKRADQLEQQAKERSETLLKESHERIQREEQAAKDALQLAFRDMVLGMKNSMLERLSEDFAKEVRQQSASVPILDKMIVEALRHIIADVRLPETSADHAEQNIEVLIPQQLLELDDIRANPEKASKGPLAELGFHLTEQMFSQGVEFTAGQHSGGIQMKLNGSEMVVDISDKAIADLLLKYLQPRFRAILEGVIH